MVDEHGADMSARDRKDARRVQAEFTFEDPQRPGRQGGRQQQQQAPRSQAPPQAQGGPQAGGSRRAAFGGSLTTSQPAQPSSRATPVASRSSTPPEDGTARDPAVLEWVIFGTVGDYAHILFAIGDTPSSCQG